MIVTREKVQEVATKFVLILQKKGLQGRPLVDAVYEAIKRELTLTNTNAYKAASLAVADSSAPGDSHIDISNSTATCLFVNIQGQLIAVPLVTLVNVIEEYRLAA